MKRVVWSLVGASRRHSEAERDRVLLLAAQFSNITGFVMDDFFNKGNGSMAVEKVHALRSRFGELTQKECYRRRGEMV